jgi:hypothetical protein
MLQRLRVFAFEQYERILSLSFQRFPPPTILFNTISLPNFRQNENDLDDDDDDLEEEEGNNNILLMAVPKRRVSHRRKRIKFFPKHLKPIESFQTCPKCLQKSPCYYQLCPFCSPFNNFIKNKDAPMKEIDRVKRIIENKILEKMDFKTKEIKKETNTTATPSSTAATGMNSGNTGNGEKR